MATPEEFLQGGGFKTVTNQQEFLGGGGFSVVDPNQPTPPRESQSFFDNPTGAPSLIETFKNIPSSAVRFGKDIYGAIRHPKETAIGLGRVVAGGVEKLIPGEQENEANFEALTGFFKERYGSLEAIKQTIETDPVGFLSDVASVITVGGAAIKGLGKVSRAKTLQSVGTSVQQAGTALEPISIASKGLGSAGSKVLAPFAGATDDVIQDIAKVQGVDLPVGAQTSSRFLGLQEVLASKGLFGGRLGKLFDTAMNKIKSIADDLVAKTGGDVDSLKAGNAIVDGLDAQKKQFIAMKTELYDEVLFKGTKGVSPLAGQTPIQQGTGALIIQAPETQALLGSYIDDIKRASSVTGKTGNLTLYDSILNKLSTGQTKIRDYYEALKQINQGINDPTSFIAQGDQARLMKLAATMSDEMDTFLRTAAEQGAIDPSVIKALDEANKFFSTNLAQLNSRLTRRIQAVASQPEKVFNIAFQPATGIDEVRQILGVLNPEDLKHFRATAMQKIIDGATSSATGKFTVAGLRKEMDKLGGFKMSLIFEPEQIKALEQLDQLSKAMGKVEKISGGSQTAFLQKGLTEMILLTIGAFQAPNLAIALIGGDFAINRLLTSTGGRKWLLDGLTLPEKVNQVIQALPATAKGAFQAGRVERVTDEE